jgi:acetate kinase
MRVAASLEAWNVGLDAARNRSAERGCVSVQGSRPVYVFDTDEERILACEAGRCLRAATKP